MWQKLWESSGFAWHMRHAGGTQRMGLLPFTGSHGCCLPADTCHNYEARSERAMVLSQGPTKSKDTFRAAERSQSRSVCYIGPPELAAGIQASPRLLLSGHLRHRTPGCSPQETPVIEPYSLVLSWLWSRMAQAGIHCEFWKHHTFGVIMTTERTTR